MYQEIGSAFSWGSIKPSRGGEQGCRLALSEMDTATPRCRAARNLPEAHAHAGRQVPIRGVSGASSEDKNEGSR